MTTDSLVERLARDLQPMGRLAPPGVRTARWAAGAIVVLAFVAVPLTSPADVAANISGGVWFVLPQVLAVLTGLAAAVSAFASVVPGYSRRAAMVAAIAAAAWVGSLAVGARGEWSQPVDPKLPSEWLCVALMLAIGAPLMFGMSRMLRKGAVFDPWLTAALSALAVMSLASVGACFTHPHTNGAVTFIWHGTTVVAAVLAFIGVGPRVLRP